MAVIELRTAGVTVSPIALDLFVAILAPFATVTIIGRYTARDGIMNALAAADPDLIVVGVQDGGDQAFTATLLAHAPGARIVMLTGDGRTATVTVTGATPIILRDPSPKQLAEAIIGGPARTPV